MVEELTRAVFVRVVDEAVNGSTLSIRVLLEALRTPQNGSFMAEAEAVM